MQVRAKITFSNADPQTSHGWVLLHGNHRGWRQLGRGSSHRLPDSAASQNDIQGGPGQPGGQQQQGTHTGHTTVSDILGHQFGYWELAVLPRYRESAMTFVKADQRSFVKPFTASGQRRSGSFLSSLGPENGMFSQHGSGITPRVLRGVFLKSPGDKKEGRGRLAAAPSRSGGM